MFQETKTMQWIFLFILFLLLHPKDALSHASRFDLLPTGTLKDLKFSKVVLYNFNLDAKDEREGVSILYGKKFNFLP